MNNKIKREQKCHEDGYKQIRAFDARDGLITI